MRTKNLIIMVGAPGSGKSTYIRNHMSLIAGIAGTTTYVSRDEIRFSLLKDNEPYFSKEKETWKIFLEKIKMALHSYDNVFVDATHLSVASRTKLINGLKNKEVDFSNIFVYALVMDVCLAKCLEQNENRAGRAYVPQDAIKNMFAEFQNPTFEEEYLDSIVFYKPGEILGYEEENYEILYRREEDEYGA